MRRYESLAESSKIQLLINMGKTEKRTLGCFAIGCITFVILGIVGIVAVSYWTKSALDSLVNSYTDESALVLPIVEIEEEELLALTQRVETFRKTIDEDELEAQIELTADELNALIIHDEKMSSLKGKVYLDIVDRQIVGEVSLPLSDLDIPFGGGRYFNGHGVFDVSLGRRGLSVKVEQLEINGKALPETFMKGFQGQNLLEKADFDDDTEAFMDRLKTVEILEESVILEVAPSADSATAEVVEGSEFELE